MPVVNKYRNKDYQEGYEDGVEDTKRVFRKMIDFNKEIKSHKKQQQL